LVLLSLDLPRQLARLANRNEPRLQAVGDRSREHETSSLDSDDLVDPFRGVRLGQRVDCRAERVAGCEQRGDVFEDDAGLRIVETVADVLLQPRGIHWLQRSEDGAGNRADVVAAAAFTAAAPRSR